MIFFTKDAVTLTKNNDKVAILPLGPIEQHGPHLPVGTDTHIVTVLSTAIEERLSNDILLCPSLAFGSSHHHIDFGGTISISPTLYTALIVELVESLLKCGFQKIVLLNGHGG